jgi:hypothetical protein
MMVSLVVVLALLGGTMPLVGGATVPGSGSVSGTSSPPMVPSVAGPPAGFPTPASGVLTALTPTPSAPDIDPGQYIFLTANATGGTPPYNYTWYSGTFSQCGNSGDTTFVGYGTKLNVSSTSGSLYYCYTATDNATPKDSAMPATAALVWVENPLAAGPVTPSSPTIDSGRTVTLASNPGGGTHSYTVTWYSSGPGSSACTLTELGTGATWPATPTGNTSYCYSVTDTSVGTPTALAFSAADLVTVDPQFSPGTVQPLSPVLDKGQSIVLTASPSGGTGPGTYTVHWYSGTSTTCPSGMTVVGTNSTAYTATPTQTTNYCYGVTDASYASAAAYSPIDTVKVNAPLVANAPKPGSPSIDLGQTITLSVNLTAGSGTPSYSYAWYTGDFVNCSATNPSLIPGQTNATLVDTPASSSYICYSVTDNATKPVVAFSPGDLVTVNPALGGGAVSPVTPTIDDGQKVVLTANPVGGTPPYTYTWFSGGNSTCAGDTTSTLTGRTVSVSPTSSAYYCYAVSDASKGKPAPTGVFSSTDFVSVDSALSAGSPTPAAPTIDGGQTVVLSAHPAGGTPVYTYQWEAPCGTPISGATGPTYAASPTTNTSYCYTLSDGSANPPTKISASDTVLVNPAVKASPVTPLTPSIDLGQNITLSAAASGGKPPYTYQWFSGRSATCAGDTTLLGTAKTQTISPVSSTYYCYNVSDSLLLPGYSVSPAVLVTVNHILVAGAVTSNTTVLDFGQSAVLLSNPSSGTKAYHVQWYSGSSSNCSMDLTKLAGATAATLTVKPSAGSSYYCYVAGDASVGTPAANTTSPAYQLTVNPTLVIHGILPASPTINQSQLLLLQANVTGGTPPLTYAWYYTTGKICSAANATKVRGDDGPTLETAPGSTTRYCFIVADSSTGTPAVSLLSGWDLVSVSVPPAPTFLGLPVVEGYIVLAVLVAVFALIGLAVFLRIRRGRRQGPAGDFL